MPPKKNKLNIRKEEQEQQKYNIEINLNENDILLTEYNKILKKYWNYDSLKDKQFEVIKKILIDKKDVCAILATGFGKSICYQLPHLITSKSVIIISPLIALMFEQSNELRDKNIPVAVFNSENTIKQKNLEKSDILDGNNKIIYMTPEYFTKSETFIKGIEDELAFVCIDEAHAVSTWGLDFRPSYTKLNLIREWLPNIPILTLTATASTKVREDITEILNLNEPEYVVGNFDRPNLLIRVESKQDDTMIDLNNLIKKYKDDYIIIYCSTRDETDLLASKITSVKCESYHAGLSDKLRSTIQKKFIDGEIKCIIATIAFGMGINITNVRLVIHFNCPKNIESYYQEIGRAGRDNKPSECVLFFSHKDFKINRYFLQSINNPVQKVYQENQIKQIEKYVYSNECRRKILLESFGQKISSCNNCDNCMKYNNINKENNIVLQLSDYTKQVYLCLNALYKINDKFGCGMLINILLGKGSKIKKWMLEYDEYGSGVSFGNIDWWKSLIRLMMNDELIQENQVTKSFFTTLSLTEKGNNLRNKLKKIYPKYINLLVSHESNDETYNYIKINYSSIESKSKTKIIKITNNTNNSTSIKTNNIKTNKTIINKSIIDNKINNKEVIKLKQKLEESDNEINSDSDNNCDSDLDNELHELLNKRSFMSRKNKDM